jgi:hypothetical protein
MGDDNSGRAILVKVFYKDYNFNRRNGAMFNSSDLGAEVYKTWSNAQRRDEIVKLVHGYRAGIPVGILCSMTEAIAGSRKRARKHLHELLTPEERTSALEQASGGMLEIVRDFLQ